MKHTTCFFTALVLTLLFLHIFPTPVYSQTPLKGFILDGDPTSCNGARWTYKDTVDGIIYDLQGKLYKPTGTGPFPAVILSHGINDNVNGSATALSNTMVTWGLECISVNFTHALNAPLGSPGTYAESGASTANILRAHKCRDILKSLGDVDTNYIAAHGYNLGAYVSAGMVGAYPNQFRVASHAGGGIGTGNATPDSLGATIITPYQIHHGIPDAQVPLEYDVALHALLQQNNVPTQIFKYPGYIHTDLINDVSMLREIKAWYAQYGLFTPVPPHQSIILRVPQEYPTIQSAIDAAQSTDTILVSEGTYYENIRYKRKGVVLTSNYYITKDWQTVRNTIIDGSRPQNIDTASTVQFLNFEDTTNVLDGFTITGGTGIRWVGSFVGREGGGIILSSSTAIIKNNIVIDNSTQSDGAITGGGGGISSMYGNPTIMNNVIVSNRAGYAGGIVLNWSKGIIRNNLIYHNECIGNWGGGGVMIWQAPKRGGIVENNTIINNSGIPNGGGITVSITDASTYPIIRNNIIWGNTQTTGGQVNMTQFLDYCNVEDYSSGTNMSFNPQFLENTFLLSPSSPCIDAGNSNSAYNDNEDLAHPGMAYLPSRGTVRNDMGAYGGSFARELATITYHEFRISSSSISMNSYTDQPATSGIKIFNAGTQALRIDSVNHTDRNRFTLFKDYTGQTIDCFQSDSIKIIFNSSVSGTFYDTVHIYHQDPGTINPINIIIAATSRDYTLNVQASHGTVTLNPPGGLYSHGMSVSVSLTPDSGYTFKNWSGDVPAGNEKDNPLMLTMNSNRSITAEFTNAFIITSGTGWNLVSVPLLQVNDSASVIFPRKYGSMMAFNSSMQNYITANSLANGSGYWIYFQNPDTSVISGSLPGAITVSIYKAGWSLIGSRSTPITANEFLISDGTIFGDMFRYDNQAGGYATISKIRPGEAAWVYVTKPCTITLP